MKNREAGNVKAIRKNETLPPQSPLMRALEPRIMFDAAVADAVATVADTHALAVEVRAADPARDNGRKEAVLIDTSLTDYKTLEAGVRAGVGIIEFDGHGDGLAQIARWAATQQGYDALHIVSHGATGELSLGTTLLTAGSIKTATNQTELAQIGHALNTGGDLLLYGCNVAAGQEGQQLISALATATGADVAASTDNTGAQSLGGNWTLERHTGSIEATLPLTASATASYHSLLSTFDFESSASGNGANTVKQTVGSDEIVITATGVPWLLDTEMNTIGSDVPNLSGNIICPDGANYQSQITISVTGGKIFDLTSFAAVDVGGETKSIRITTTKGGATYNWSGAVSLSKVFTLGTEAQGVTSVTITTSDASNQFCWAFDNFVLNNILVPLNAPTLSATAGSPLFTENGSAVSLFSGTNAATNDAGQSFTGMTLSVTNALSNDVLTIDGTDVVLTNGGNGTLSTGNYAVAVSSGTATVTLTGLGRTNAQMNTLVDGITYKNTGEDPGTSRTVTITGITDNGSNSNSASPNIAASVTVVPVNDAPILISTALSPGYTEKAAAVSLFNSTSVDVVESGQSVNQLMLTVSNVSDGASEILRADGTDIALTNGTSGTTAGNSLGYSVSVAGSTATLTFSKAGFSTAVAQTIVNGLTYRDTSNAPTTGARVVTLTSIQDTGGGSDTTALSVASTVTVSAVNDAPTITAPGSIAVTEDVSGALTGISFADVDAGSSSVTASFSVGSGTLAATSGGGVTVAGSGTTSLTLTGSLSNINAFIAASSLGFTTASNATANVTLSIGIDDGGNTGGGGAKSASTTSTLTVSAVNDAPTLTAPATIGVTEDVTAPLTGISFADVDAGASSVTATLSVGSGTLGAVSGGGVTALGSGTSALTLTGSIANINAFITGSNVSYTTALNATADVTLTTSINDGGNTGSGGAKSASQTTTLQVTAVNDAPVVTQLNGDSRSFSVGGTAITLDTGGNATVSDVDSSDFSGGNVTVSIVANGQAAEDVLGIQNQGNGAGQIGVSGATVSYGGTAIGSVAGGTGGADLVISLNASATPAAVQALVRMLTYNDTDAATANTATRTVRVTVNDGDGGTSSNQDVSVALMRAPILDLDTGSAGTGATGSFTEDGSAVAVTGTTSASDDGTFKSLTVTLTNHPDGAAESLSSAYGSGAQTVNGEAVTIGAYNSATGVLNITIDDGSTTAATLQMLMESIRYNNTSHTPSTTSRSISFAATDNDNNLGNASTSTVSITAVNDAPSFSAGATLTAVLEDASNPAGATVDALFGAKFSDPDGNAMAGIAIGGDAALTAQGKWQYSTNAGANWYDVSATAVSTSQALLLDHTSLLRFVPAADYNGTPGALTVFAVDDSSASSFTNGATRTTFDTTADGATSRVSAAGVSLATSVTAMPDITAATYDANTGVLTVTGNDFSANGGGADVDPTLLTLAGEGGASYALTSAGVEITDATHFSVTLNAADQAAVNQILNKNGTTSTGGSTFTLSAANGYMTGVVVGNTADAGNGVTVSNVAAPTVTSATYDASTGSLVVTGTGFLKYAGAANDVIASDFTLTGEGGTTYTLTDTSNVEITSGTQFSLSLSATDRAALGLILNKNGAASTTGTTYNLAAANHWAAGADAAVNDADLTGNGITVANVAVPSITSATYDPNTGVLAVTGVGFLKRSGAANDIDVSKLTLKGEAAQTYTLTSASVEITDATHFSVTLNSTDKTAVNALLNLAGLQSTGGTVYNLAAADHWAAGADAAVPVGDLINNGVTVSALAPDASIIGVTSSDANGAYKIGDTITLQVNFDHAVTLDTSGGLPTLSLGTGTGRVASYVSGSGSTTLTFSYVVQEGDHSADLDYTSTSALALNGATAPHAVMSLPTPGSASALGGQKDLVVDGIRPTARIVVADNQLSMGESTAVTITFSEAVKGFGNASLDVANGTLSNVSSSDGGVTWTASFTPTAGVTAQANTISLKGAAVTDLAGNASMDAAVSNTFAINTVQPTIVSVTPPGDHAYKAGDVLSFTVSSGEAVLVDTTGGVPRLALDVGGTTVYASYASGSGSKALTFTYTVQAGQNDTDGIAVLGLQTNGGAIKSAAGNAAALTLNGVGATQGVTVDTLAPSVVSLAPVSEPGPSAGTLSYRVTFAENVIGVDTADFALTKAGGVDGVVSSVTAVDARTYVVTVSGISGIGSLSLGLAPGSTITDAAGNPVSGTVASTPHLVDTTTHVAPVPPVATLPTTPAQTSTATIPTLGTPAAEPLVVLSAVAPQEAPSLAATGASLFAPPGLTHSSGPLEDLMGPVPNWNPVQAVTTGRLLTSASPTAPGESAATTVPDPHAGYVATGTNTHAALEAIPRLGTQMLSNDRTFSFNLPAATFVSSDPDASLTVEARLQNGAPLPPWLRFDPVTGSFSGRPPAGWTRSLYIEIIARDGEGHRASTVIELDFHAPDRGASADPAPLVKPGRAGLDAQLTRHGRTAQQAQHTALHAQLQAALHKPART